MPVAMGSLRTRLALSVFVIVLGVVAIVALGTITALDRSLRAQALRDLSRSAHRYSQPIDQAIDRGAPAGRINRLVRDAADAATARVTLLGVYRTPAGLQTFVKSDSTRQVEIRDLQFDVASEAARTGHTTTGEEAGDIGRVGEAALPLAYRDPRTHRRVIGSVIVYSAPLDSVAADVRIVRRRALTAGAAALVAAAIAALLTARALSLRVRRLERVASRVAEGDLTARFPVDATDEIGQLARTLDDMRRQLEELDSARKRFIAIASHELRTPLFSLGGFLELLEEEELDEDDRRRFLAQLRQQVARMQKLATDLLDLSKLEAGSLELRPEPTDLADVARMVAGEFAPALSAHGSHVELRLPQAPLEVDCDPERVAQVMRILSDNAITHTPPGTDLVVSASRRGDRARLGVGDFGPGIHRTMLPRIFEPFVTSDDAQGSGLGLAIASELAERMSGHLAVDSHPGRTTFTLELPA
jgi:two-component system, OmpR family, sensor kinase